MRQLCSLCLYGLLSLFAMCAESNAATHVLYFSNGYSTTGSTLTTYKVDPTTGVPTQVGTTLSFPTAQYISNIVPSPNDHFVYIFWVDTNSNNYLWVYDTDVNGVPQSTPVQKLSAQGWQMMIHKSGKYAYVMKTTYSQQNGNTETLYLYHINQTTGVLTQDATIQATYGPDFYYQGSLVSFNKAGTRLYDDWGLHFHDNDSDTYSYHPVNSTTGQLSPDVGTYFAISGGGQLNEQYFTTSYILNLHNDMSGNPSILNLYPNKKNPTQPSFTCTQSMLPACGGAYNYYVSIDEQYVFLPDGTDTTIGRIEGSSKLIAQTGTITGYTYLTFAPDNELIYGTDGTNGIIQVFLFNSANGTVTPGGTITFNPNNGSEIFPALHQ